LRTRGWQGTPPVDDAEARERIIAAAMRCIDRYGAAKTGLSDVATELGVTRQTVYRLFPSTQDLFREVAGVAAQGFLDRLQGRVAELSDPADIIVEALAFTIERLPNEPYVGILLAAGDATSFSQQVTATQGFAVARAMVEQMPVDWPAVGFDDQRLDELTELMLRLLQSFSLDPGKGRTRAERRAFLRRWLGAAITAQIESRPAAAR